MKETPKSKLWNQAIKHLSREADEYEKIHSALNSVLLTVHFRSKFADRANEAQVLRVAIQPQHLFQQCRKETAQIKEHADAIARLLKRRGKKLWSAAVEPVAYREADDDDIPF